MAMSKMHIVRGVFLSLFILNIASAQSVTKPAANAVSIDHAALSKLHWQLTCQASSFRDMTFFEMVDRLHEMGVHHIELSPGQVLSSDFPNVKISPQMTAEQIEALQAKLKTVKMDIVSYGVVSLSNDSDELQRLFDFARKLKLKNIVAVPVNVSLESLDKIAQESNVHVAILIQADTGSTCDTYLQLIAGRSPFVGLCLDVQALHRAGLSPSECVGKLKGRIVEVNLTDINDELPDHVDLRGTLNQLRQQNFKGIFAIQSKDPSGWIDSANKFSAATSRTAESP
jgi:sugar phosphate isomerase/epimerase